MRFTSMKNYLIALLLCACKGYSPPASPPVEPNSASKAPVYYKTNEEYGSEPPPPPPPEMPKRVEVQMDQPVAANGHKPSTKRTGEGVGLGSYGTIGHGSGTGSGYGRGAGAGDGELMGHSVTVSPITPVPPEENPLSLVDDILAKLKTGNIAFNSPKEMKVEESEVVELILSLKETTASLAKQLSGTNIETAEGIKLAPRMEATLTGTNFNIKEMTPSEQAISGSQTTKWSWAVTAEKPGMQILHLSLSTRIEIQGKDTPFIVNTFERKIVVKTTPMTIDKQISSFINDNWKWLWSTIVVPVAIWLWNRKRKTQTAKS